MGHNRQHRRAGLHYYDTRLLNKVSMVIQSIIHILISRSQRLAKCSSNMATIRLDRGVAKPGVLIENDPDFAARARGASSRVPRVPWCAV